KTDEQIELPVRGVFFEIGSAPSSMPVKDLVELDEKQEIIVDCSNKTSMPGIFAAGDVTSVPQKQIIVAAGEGAKAALSAYDYVIRLPEDTK
ncbi:MAG: FAD-dependent oxidoreductase, partial [Candidatus Aquicultor sp.]